MARESDNSVDDTHLARTQPEPDPPKAVAVQSSPTKVGRFVVLQEVGRGAMGVVFAAYDADLDRKVAVKLLHRGEQEAHRARMYREAQAMAKISHPNVVHVYEVGLFDGQVYLAMEYVEGTSLSGWLEQDERTREEIIDVFLAAGRGLAQAHSSELIHRDFKPDNVLVGADGKPRVVDFGLARSVGDGNETTRSHGGTIGEDDERRDAMLPESSLASGTADLTVTGAILGTPAYMSPEQFEGDVATAASDQFSFCVSLWEALCGQRPFRGKTLVALGYQVRKGNIQPMPASADVPVELRKVLERGLSTEPAERWPSMDALLEAITPRQQNNKRFLALAGAITLLVGAGVGAAVAAAGGDETVDPCENVDSALIESWGEKRQAQVKAGLIATGPAYAESVAETVGGQLDAYATAWGDAAEGACKATHDDKTQSELMLELQRQCLDRGLSALDGLASEFETADESVLETAQEAAAALPSIEDCLDNEALLAATPPPDDPAMAAEVQQLRRAHAALSARLSTGRYAQALPELRALDERARELGYLPLMAELAADIAFAMSSTDTGADITKEFERAYFLGTEAGSVAVIVRSATDMGSHIGFQDHRYEAAHTWFMVAEANLPRLSSGAALAEAKIRKAEGTVFARDVRYEEAAQAYARAGKLYEQEGDVLGQYAIMGDQAIVLVNQGQMEQGAALMREARDKSAEARGPNHPTVGVLTQNLAAITSRTGDADGALELYREAVAIAEKSRGRNHPSYWVPMCTIANILLGKGELKEAREYAEQALELSGDGTPTMDMAEPYMSLMGIDVAEGNYAGGKANLIRAKDILEQSVGPDHPRTAEAYVRIAGFERKQGNYERAIEVVHGVLETTEKLVGYRVAGDAYMSLAKTYLAMGETTQSRTWAEKAAAWFDKMGAPASAADTRDWIEDKL